MKSNLIVKYIFTFSFLISTIQYSYSQSGRELYNKVQNIYVNASKTNRNCSQVKNYISQLGAYRGYRQPVPSDKAYSVNFPNRVSNPVIADLVNDRIARLKSQYKRCFTAPADPRSVQLYNQVQNIYGRYSGISANNCTEVNRLINELSAFKGNNTPVPPNKAYSVSFKGRVANPTIGHLAEDRIARVQSRFKNCASTNNYAMELYNKVQNIYLSAPRRQSVTQADCNTIKAVIKRLEPYRNYGERVPAKWTYTVLYPYKKTNPNIADLAIDRIERLKQLSENCNRTVNLSSYAVKNLPGVYNYSHKGRNYQLRVTRINNTLSANYDSHEYSYPPIYKNTTIVSGNTARFTFSLGSTYSVNLELTLNNSAVSAVISESWERNARVNLGTIGLKQIKTEREISTDGSVSVTFINNTRANTRIYWVNFQGVEVKYYDLPPGKSYVQATYNTHKWVVRQGGRILMRYTANNYKKQSVTIR